MGQNYTLFFTVCSLIPSVESLPTYSSPPPDSTRYTTTSEMVTDLHSHTSLTPSGALECLLLKPHVLSVILLLGTGIGSGKEYRHLRGAVRLCTFISKSTAC